MPEKPQPQFYATIQGDKVQVTNRLGFASFIRKTFKEGDRVILRLIPFKKIRTLPQNNFYWLYLNIISDNTGDLADDLHEYFKRKLLSPRYVTVLGKEVKLPATTTKLDKQEFSEYIDKIEALTGIAAPNPEEIWG